MGRKDVIVTKVNTYIGTYLGVDISNTDFDLPMFHRRAHQISKHFRPSYSTTTANMTTNPSKYKFNHSMLRVKDPKASVKFYEHLGMSVVNKLEFPDNKFDLYFLSYDSPKAASHGKRTSSRDPNSFLRDVLGDTQESSVDTD